MPLNFPHIRALLLRLGIAMLLFSLCRLLFYIFNASYFSGLPAAVFFFGLRYDLSAVAMFYAPIILLQTLPLPFRHNRIYRLLLKWTFLIISAFCIILNCIDFEYFKFTLKRATSDLFPMMGLGHDFLNLLPAFLADYWYVALTALLLFLLTLFLYNKTAQKKQVLQRGGLKYYLLNSAVMLLFIAAGVYAIRGGFQLRPLNIINAAQYADTRYIPVILNTPFTVAKTVNRNIDEVSYMDADEAEEVFNPVKEMATDKRFKPMNVAIIILESLSKEYVGALSGKETYTPFLDSLLAESYVFERCFANGKESMKGIPAVLAGLPSLMNAPFITSAYSGDGINSIASILRQKGYSTHFFHGGANGTLGFDGFASAAGFEHYYGRDEYGNDADFDGHWGIYDEPFFHFFADKLSESKKPFVAALFSLSSHHPFELPARYDRKFKKGKFPILTTVQYTDMALKRFFMYAAAQPWYENTLFVITADHTGNPIGPEYQSSVGSFAIPLVFFKPGEGMKGMDQRVTQQCDILPAILHLLHYRGHCIAFGNDPFDQSCEGFSISFANNVYQLISGDYVLLFDGNEALKLFNYREDSLLRNDLLTKKPQRAAAMLKLLKAYIQTYNQRLIHNQLTPQ
ncbi:MAG: LTA synthase family protein [Flavobacteriales bacterium]